MTIKRNGEWHIFYRQSTSHCYHFIPLDASSTPTILGIVNSITNEPIPFPDTSTDIPAFFAILMGLKQNRALQITPSTRMTPRFHNARWLDNLIALLGLHRSTEVAVSLEMTGEKPYVTVRPSASLHLPTYIITPVTSQGNQEWKVHDVHDGDDIETAVARTPLDTSFSIRVAWHFIQRQLQLCLQIRQTLE